MLLWVMSRIRALCCGEATSQYTGAFPRDNGLVNPAYKNCHSLDGARPLNSRTLQSHRHNRPTSGEFVAKMFARSAQSFRSGDRMARFNDRAEQVGQAGDMSIGVEEYLCK